jgi:hypothetical protein
MGHFFPNGPYVGLADLVRVDELTESIAGLAGLKLSIQASWVRNGRTPDGVSGENQPGPAVTQQKN